MATEHDSAPQTLTLFQRAHYTLASGIAATMTLLLAGAVLTFFVPQLEIIPFFLSARVWWLLVPLYVVAWVAAPHLSLRLPNRSMVAPLVLPSNSALLADAFSSLRCACGAAKRER